MQKVSFTIVFCAIFATFICYYAAVSKIHGTPNNPGVFGDMFGALNAFFAAMAFMGIAMSLWIQSGQRRDEQSRHEREVEMAFLSAYLQTVPTILEGIDLAIARAEQAANTTRTKDSPRLNEALISFLNKRNEVTERFNQVLVHINQKVDDLIVHKATKLDDTAD